MALSPNQLIPGENAPSDLQLYEIIAVLARGHQIPNNNTNQTGAYRNSANQISIPIDNSAQGINNALLGSKVMLGISADGTRAHIALNVGDVVSGA